MPRKPAARPNEAAKTRAPALTSGYSGTPLPKKLGVDGDRTVLLLNAPKGFEAIVDDGSGRQRIKRGGRGQGDVVICFVKSRAELESCVSDAIAAMAEGGGLWFAWPKKASGIVTDVTEDVIRNAALPKGIVDYKVCAIDATWSGLKFARRKK